ncbi:Hypothetical predicted protein [Octopus vulgaris]|uniref:Uncharacterized protein n=1 Tax=Octopus vulgaris TaxID=6645 RepID=A0AA36BJF3_OCTVU|nr:Hypothetical predicted protein [Octopus vulgaris]
MKADNVYDDDDDKNDVDANVGANGDGGYHVNVGDVDDVDDVRVCEGGRMVWEGGRMSVIKTDDDLKDSFSGDNNPYRKKVARVVVVISVVMLIMSILLVCVSLNMSKNIDDLVRSNNDLLRKSYEKDHFEDNDNDLMNITLANTTEP